MKELNRTVNNRPCVVYSSLLVIIVLLILKGSTCCASPSISAESTNIDFGMATKHDLDVGFIEPAPSPLDYMLRLYVSDTVSENWVVGVRADSPYFFSSGIQKPCGDLKWRINGSSTWYEMSPFSSEIAHGNGNALIDMDFLMLTDWQDAPDVHYGLTLVFTVSQEF